MKCFQDHGECPHMVRTRIEKRHLMLITLCTSRCRVCCIKGDHSKHTLAVLPTSFLYNASGWGNRGIEGVDLEYNKAVPEKCWHVTRLDTIASLSN